MAFIEILLTSDGGGIGVEYIIEAISAKRQYL